jgi:hypothetical protein
MISIKEKLDILMSDPEFLLELEKAYQQAKKTSDYLIEASKVKWEDLHRPVTI